MNQFRQLGQHENKYKVKQVVNINNKINKHENHYMHMALEIIKMCSVPYPTHTLDEKKIKIGIIIFTFSSLIHAFTVIFSTSF